MWKSTTHTNGQNMIERGGKRLSQTLTPQFPPFFFCTFFNVVWFFSTLSLGLSTALMICSTLEEKKHHEAPPPHLLTTFARVNSVHSGRCKICMVTYLCSLENFFKLESDFYAGYNCSL